MYFKSSLEESLGKNIFPDMETFRKLLTDTQRVLPALIGISIDKANLAEGSKTSKPAQTAALETLPSHTWAGTSCSPGQRTSTGELYLP